MSNFVWPEPIEACTAEATVTCLLQWCKALGVVTGVGERYSLAHFKNRVIAQLSDALQVKQHTPNDLTERVNVW